MNKENQAQRGSKTVIERTYRARVEEIWELWTTKDGLESWWGPEGFRVEVHALEARAGGTLEYDMIADSPEMIAAMKRMGHAASHATHSRFTEVKRHDRLVLTNVIDFLPGVETYESNIAVDFCAVGPAVRMVVTLEGMHSDEFTSMQKEGFTSQLTKLDKRFAWRGGYSHAADRQEGSGRGVGWPACADPARKRMAVVIRSARMRTGLVIVRAFPPHPNLKKPGTSFDYGYVQLRLRHLLHID